MAKDIIRHLEYYGFPDQNQFSRDGDIDLEPIHHKDKKQDREIHELFHRTHMLKDWNIKQENDIKDLKENYNVLAPTVIENDEEIKELSGDIKSISGTVEQITEAIGGLPFPSINEKIDEISGKVDDNHDEFLAYSASTAKYLKEYSEWVDLRYVHNDDIDSLISSGLSGYATEDWVKSQGYLTEVSGDSVYLRQDVFKPYSALTQSNLDNLETSARTLANDVHVLDEKVNDYHTQVENYISKTNTLEDEVDALNSRVGNVESEIVPIKTSLNYKVDNSTFNNSVERLDGRIDNLSSSTDTKLDVLDGKKVGKDVYDSYTASTLTEIDNLGELVTSLENNKASVDSVSSIKDDLDAEIANRINGDSNLQGQIDNIKNTTIQNINDRIDAVNIRVDNVNNSLSQEVVDRKSADLALIGSSDDAFTANTINGAKKEAARQGDIALNSAKEYTNAKINEVRNVDIVNLRNEVETSIASKANIGDLSVLANNLTNAYENADSILNERLINQIEAEAATRFQDDQDLRRAIQSNDSEIAALSTKANGITSWDGTGTYDNSGNGVLDVLHREFHDYVENDGIIESIDYDGENLIIKYKTAEGEKITIIPVGTIVDLSNYYKKQEVDSLISSAVEEINIENYYTKSEIDLMINEETERAINAEQVINDKIDNLVLECGLY